MPDRIFAQRLREAMEERGMKPTDLSEASGVDKAAISNYLNGKYNAKQDKVYALARALHVNPAWLMGKSENKSAVAEAQTPMDEEIQIMSRGMQQLSAADRKRLIDMCRLMFREAFDQDDGGEA